MNTGYNNAPVLASLESLRSTGSQSSLRNVFSQSQKLTDIATRYINIQDENGAKKDSSDSIAKRNAEDIDGKQRVKSIQQLIADKEKGTPRFNRAAKGVGIGGGKQKISLRKKKSHEGQGIFVRESFNQEKNATRQTHLGKALKIGVRSLKTPEDQLSGNQDENSISSLTQQKDMKSLMGILRKHEQQKVSGTQNT